MGEFASRRLGMSRLKRAPEKKGGWSSSGGGFKLSEVAFLLIILCILVLPAKGQPWSGSGTEGDPYLIEDADDMQAIGADWSYWGAHFKLTNDINLAGFTGNQFNIIGTGWDYPFTLRSEYDNK